MQKVFISLCISRVPRACRPQNAMEELKIEPLLFRVHVEWNTKGEHCLWLLVMRGFRRSDNKPRLPSYKSIILFVTQLTLMLKELLSVSCLLNLFWSVGDILCCYALSAYSTSR